MRARRCICLMPLLLFTVACGGSQSTVAPARTEVQTSTPAPAPLPVPVPTTTQCTADFPAVAKPARIYLGTSCPTYPIHGGPLVSRYVLYDNGEFALQYSSQNYRFFEYLGSYGGPDSQVSFSWEGWSVAGPWASTGVLTEQSLVVTYNLVMKMSDFEDGLYVRAR